MAVLSVFLLCFSMAACQPQSPAVKDPVSHDPVSATVCENENYALRLVHECDYAVQAIYGIGDGWVNVYGTYKGEEGFFYVNETGQVFKDTVYKTAYPFSGGWAKAKKADNAWYILNPDGTEEPSQSGSPTVDYTRETTMVDGEERWYIDSRYGEECDPILSWIETADWGYNYAVLAEGEHKNVLIDVSGEVLVTLPDDCKGATVGDSAMVGRYDGDNCVLYRPMDHTGKVLGEHSFRVLTQQSLFLAAGCLDERLVLVDDKGEIVLDTSIAFRDTPEAGCLALDKDLVAMLNKDGKLVLYRVELKQESLRRVALELMKKAAEIGALYRSEGDVDMDKVLKEGTIVNLNGTAYTLEGDAYKSTASLFGEKLNSMQDLRQAIQSVYTGDAAEYYYNHSKFVEHDGVLYNTCGGAGYLPISMPGSLQLMNVTENEVTFNFSEYYNSFADVTTDSYAMVKTADGWRLKTTFSGILPE